jgi:uncharacterized delta-60 repeat protein
VIRIAGILAVSLLVYSCSKNSNSGGQGGATPPNYLDKTFGVSGKVDSEFSTGYDVINDLLLQPDGKIVAVGSTGTPSAPKFLVVRYNVNGTVDSTFKGGKPIEFSKGAVPYSAFLDSTGRIVVAGASDGAMAIVRLNNDGSLDETFGEKGKLSATVGTRSSAFCAAPGSDDSILVGGFTLNGEMEEMALTKFTKAGTAVEDFKGPKKAGNGKFSFAVGNGNSRIYSLKSKNDSVLAVGTAFNGSNYDFAVVKLKTDGEPDSSFGSEGHVMINQSSSGDDVLKSMVWLDDGKILVAGISAVDSQNFNILIYRLKEDGTVDGAFGAGGFVKLPWNVTLYGGALLSGFVKITVDHQNRIYVASEPTVDNHSVFGVARLTADGQLDTTYGKDGMITTVWNPNSNTNAAAHALVIQSDGKALLGGYNFVNSNYHFALVRYKP